MDTPDGAVGMAHARVVAAGAPEDEFEPAAGELAMEREAFQADGRTEPRGGGSAGGLKRVVATIDFVAGAGGVRVPKSAMRMRVGVVAERVAAADDLGDERGVTCGFFADDKKRGAGVVRIEEIEDAGRGEGIGAVIDREPDLAAVGPETADERTEAARRGHEELPDKPRRGSKKNEGRERAVSREKQRDAGGLGERHAKKPETEGERATKDGGGRNGAGGCGGGGEHGGSGRAPMTDDEGPMAS